MESSFTNKYTLLITVMVASMTAAMSIFFVFERDLKSNSSSEQIQKLEYLIGKIEKTSNLQEEVDRLRKENVELTERAEFYKEKNEFLTKQISELQRKE